VVWGSVYWSSAGKGTAGWFRSYYCAYYANNSWQIEEIYGEKFSEDQSWTPSEDYIGHPTFALSSDSGYIAFKFPAGGDLHIVGFLLNNPFQSSPTTIVNTSSITQYSSIGYDPGGRLVVLVQESAWGPMRLYTPVHPLTGEDFSL